MLNILFHGASVTEQNHETSYFHQLQLLCQRRPDLILRKKGYGGRHLNDAGFLTIGYDTEYVTDICFLDWNSTGLDFFDDDKLKYIIGTLLDKKIVPIFLIFARADSLDGLSNRRSESQIIKFCDKYEIPLLDLRNAVSVKDDLRDVVHTNINGALKYANLIFSYLTKFDVNSFKCINFFYPKFSINRILDVNGDYEVGRRILMIFDNVCENSHLIVETIHGPSSGLIDVNKGHQKISIWDVHSHYERPGHVILTRDFMSYDDHLFSVELLVLSDEIDYSKCTRPFDFEGIKDFKIRGLYCINCNFINIVDT